MELRGKTALVTGAAVRVGKAIALALAGRGADVAITYRSSAEEAERTAAEIRALGVRALALQCDQREPERIRTTVDEVQERLGPMAVLVNSAAIFEGTSLADLTVEEWDRHMEVNLRGPWLFCQAVGPQMKERGEGVIVNIVDVAAERPYVGYLPYSVSKAGLVALTRGLARALAPEVRVNGIAPGTVLWPDGYPEEKREITIRKTPLRRTGRPYDVAAAALFLIEGSDFVTGAIVPVDGGINLA